MPFFLAIPGTVVPPPPPPVNVVAPTLSGTVTENQTLSTNVGTWTGSPTYTYAYYFDGVQDMSQTGSTVNLTGKAGTLLYVIVTGHNAAGDTPAQSITYGPVATAPAFSFTPVTNAALSTLYVSNTVTMVASGSISVTGGEYSKNGGAFTTASGTAVIGDTITVRGASSASNTTTVNVVFSINAFNAQFSITTIAGAGFSTIPVTLGDTWNYATKTNGNLTLTANTSLTWYNQSSALSSYKLYPMTYFEVTVDQLPCYIGVGAFNVSLQDYAGNANNSVGIGCHPPSDAANGIVFNSGGYGMQFTNTHPPAVGTVIGIAFDDHNNVYFRVNGFWAGDFGYVFDPVAKTGGFNITTTTPANCELGAYVGVGGQDPAGHVVSGQLTCNFGATAFAYAPPTGYQSVNASTSGNPPNPSPRVAAAPTKPTNMPTNFWDLYKPATYPGIPTTVTYYIDASHGAASNNNAGTSSSLPWATLQAINNRSFLPGTVIAFKAGTSYQGTTGDPNSTRAQVTCNGTAAYPIIFTSYGAGAKPIIQAIDLDFESSISVGLYSGSNFGLSAGPRTASYIVIDGLDLKGGRVGSGSVRGNQACVTINSGSHDIEMYNNEMHDNGGGPYATGGAYNLTANFNYIHDLTEVVDDGTDGSFGSEAITVGGTSDSPCHDCNFNWNSYKNCISPSVIYTYDGGLLELFGYVSNVTMRYCFAENSQGTSEGGGFPGYAQNIDVSYNIFKNCATMSVYHNGGGLFGGLFVGITMNYNTFYQVTTSPPDTHLGVWYTDAPLDNTQVTADHNIIYMAQPTFGFYANGATATTPSNVHTNNDYCRGGVADADIPIMFGTADPNSGLGTGDNIVSDPLFTDPATNDFSLQGGSPSVGRGAMP